jgi:hypothetical protein
MRIFLACLAAAAVACSRGDAPPPGDPAIGPPDAGGTPGQPDASGQPSQPDGGTPGWVVESEEDFQSADLGAPQWQADPVPDDGPFADQGAFFRKQHVVQPQGFRISSAFGRGGWLTLESYTRNRGSPFSSHASIVADPADPSNRVLRIASPAHTDGTVVRPTRPLPERYRVSLRVGFANFGDGRPGLNGYGGGETAEPWSNDDATAQNGFYWLTILDSVPRPHNNTWIHHHRKVVIDSDNNVPPWMQIFDGRQFVVSGEHPIMMFALDGKGQGTELTGKPFLSYSAGAWQPSGDIRAVDSYLPGEWYRVSIERSDGRFTMEISGRFRYGGQSTYRSTIDAAASCVWHFNRSAAEDASRCVDEGHLPSLDASFPNWPAGATWPDWFMFGDPHTNYYEGDVLYDDVRLEVWR